MAVMQNSIIFGGVDSADFGIYISGEGVFDAPKRAVEVIQVPGRNGAITIDQGYYENIRVTYPAFNYEVDLETFSNQLEAFRNAICSQIGYQRLTDTIHPDEYRMAVYYEGLEIKPIMYNTAATFDIVFDCKPQRWLTSGETVTTVANNGTLTNPTLYDSGPLLQFNGYGTITFNGYTIDVNDPFRGDVVLVAPQIYTYTDGAYDPDAGIPYAYEEIEPIDVAQYDDTITIGQMTFYWVLYLQDNEYGDEKIGTVTATGSGALGGKTTILSRANRTLHMRTIVDAATVTPWDVTQEAHTVTLNVSYTSNGAKTKTMTYNLGYQFSAEGGDVFKVEYTNEPGASSYEPLEMWVERIATRGISVDSTVSVLGNPTYIDCEIGECYKIENGEVIDLNSRIDLGSDLPKLAPGTNTFTKSNTVTQLKVTPRWWIL